MFLVSKLKAQNEPYLQAFSNLLTINPAFAGYNDNTALNTGNQYYRVSDEQAYNLFYASYDTYSNKLKGGIGISFQHGLIASKNTTTSELSISYAGFEIKTANGRIRSSLSAGISLATKQWLTYLMDMIYERNSYNSSPPGKKFTRYYLIKPGASFLWDSKKATWGIAVKAPLVHSLSNNEIGDNLNTERFPFDLSFYLTKKLGGNQNGLKSAPYEAYPQLIIFYNEAFILSRASLTIKQINKSYGLFIQNDFTNNIHSLGGTIGYRINNMRMSLNSGIGIPGISDHIGAMCEFSLNLIIPPVYYSKIKPWAPKRK